MALSGNSYEILKGWPITWSEKEMTAELLWNSKRLINILIRNLDDHRILMKFYKIFNQNSDQKIRWPRNSYEILKGWTIFWSEYYITTEFLWSSKSSTDILIRKIDDHRVLMKLYKMTGKVQPIFRSEDYMTKKF